MELKKCMKVQNSWFGLIDFVHIGLGINELSSMKNILRFIEAQGRNIVWWGLATNNNYGVLSFC